MPTTALIIPPAVEPITLTEVKAHLRLDGSDEDAWLNTVIKAARVSAENYLRRFLITQTWRLAYKDTTPESIELKSGVQSLVSVKTIDSEGVETAIDTSTYFLGVGDVENNVLYFDAVLEGGRIEIDYIIGYGLADDVPADIKQALLLCVASFYNNRGDDASSEMPAMARALLLPYRVVRL